MIISASYKTDIPTFYCEWFMSRLKAGYCKMINPYSQKIYKIDLTAESVDGFVFWTKNVGPFLRHLPEVQRMGYPFIVQHNTDWAAQEYGFSWSDHEAMTPSSVRNLISELAEISRSHGMRLKICSQKAFLALGISEEARCVDAERLERVSGGSIADRVELRGNRKECGCFASKDIGEYETCPHGCVYCYAAQHRELALSRFKEHDPNSEFLFPPKDYSP
jgi:hypothetical protein